MKIIRYGSYEDIDVEFLDEFHYIKRNQAYTNFRTGSVKNPYDKSLFGIGFLGDGEYVSRKNDKCGLVLWRDVIVIQIGIPHISENI